MGLGRWTAIFLGLFGSYGKDDSVDVQYRLGSISKTVTGVALMRAVPGASRAIEIAPSVCLTPVTSVRSAEEGGWRDIGLLVSGPAASRLAPYYDALIAWSLRKHARIRELRSIIQRFSETSGKLQWQFGGPMRRMSPWALSTTRDLSQGCDVEVAVALLEDRPQVEHRIDVLSGRRVLAHG